MPMRYDQIFVHISMLFVIGTTHTTFSSFRCDLWDDPMRFHHLICVNFWWVKLLDFVFVDVAGRSRIYLRSIFGHSHKLESLASRCILRVDNRIALRLLIECLVAHGPVKVDGFVEGGRRIRAYLRNLLVMTEKTPSRRLVILHCHKALLFLVTCRLLISSKVLISLSFTKILGLICWRLCWLRIYLVPILPVSILKLHFYFCVQKFYSLFWTRLTYLLEKCFNL